MLPALPAGFGPLVQAGTPIADVNWSTVAIAAYPEIAAGSPQVIAVDIPAALLTAGRHCIVALANAPQDLFAGVNTNVVALVTAQSKALMKYLLVT